jgi:GTP cyclohydrolase I
MMARMSADQSGPSSRERLSDAAHHDAPAAYLPLDRVGMRGIQVPIRLRDPATGAALLAPATAEAEVDLADSRARGIHMSRLYLTLQAMLADEDLTGGLLARIAHAFLGSHRGLSSRARVRVAYEQLVKRPALVSAHAGWRSYPVWIQAEVGPDAARLVIGAEVLYASTCPCSAALARQAVAEAVRARFGAGEQDISRVAEFLATEEGQPAVAHAQRSRARAEVALAGAGAGIGPVELIDLLERALGTAVQGAVKREDELEFARRAAANLMFCEDAARRARAALEAETRIEDWRIEVAHFESLHPHDAVAAAAKGVPGGFRP